MSRDDAQSSLPLTVLIVGALFPPENAISAIRLGKFAQYLAESGDTVEVVTRVSPLDGAESTSALVPARVFRFRDPLTGIERRVKNQGPTVTTPSLWARLRASLLFARLRRTANRALTWPDRFVFWGLITIHKTRREDLHPDVIVASGPPLSALIVGAALAKRLDCPWVADYRDLLAFGTYNESGRLRTAIERWIERRVVRSAAEIVTVSEPLARDLQRVFGKPVHVVKNGFDPSDFPRTREAARAARKPKRPLTISYCGEIYQGKRDPSPLFVAMEQLDREGIPIRARFYGSGSGTLRRLVDWHEVGHLVELNARVPHLESLAIQRDSDLLLLLMWNDPREEGVYSGKLFEYLGSRRPILMLGYERGVAADMIVGRAAGVVANDASAIADALRAWAIEHDSAGISSLPATVGEGLTRRDQTSLLRSVLARAVAGTRS